MNLFTKIVLGAVVSLASITVSLAQIPNFRTLAGSGGRLDSTGIFSQLNAPYLAALSADSQYIYFADQAKHSIRKINIATSRVTTLVGNGYNNNTISGGSALNVYLNFPTSVAHVGDSILYITSFGQNACNFCGGGITQVNFKTGFTRVLSLGTNSFQAITGISVIGGAVVDTVFYTGAYNTTGGLTKLVVNRATGALISSLNIIPVATAVVGSIGTTPGASMIWGDSILVADRANGRILIAGKNAIGFRVFLTGLNQPYGLAKASDTTIYITDGNSNRVILYNVRSTSLTTLASGLSVPRGIVSNDTAIFVTEEFSNRIRYALKSASGVFKNFSGRSGTFFNGEPRIATFNQPNDVALGQSRTLYVADRGSKAIREVNLNSGLVSSVRTVNGISDIVYKDSVLYYTESERNAVYRISSFDLKTGRTQFLAGASGFTGPEGNQVDGDSATSRLKYPTGLVIDNAGRNLYFGSVGANAEGAYAVRRVNIATKITTTIAGAVTPTQGYVDAIGNNARFGQIPDVAISGDTILYVADQTNDRIRQIDLRTMAVTTVAGSGFDIRNNPRDNISGLNATIANVGSFGIDSANGYLYFSDINQIRRMLLIGTNTIITVAGGSVGYLDGLSTASRFSNPNGMVLDSTGKNLYLADGDNGRIRTASFIINTAPSFAKGPDTNALENAPLQVINNWATNIVKGSLAVESTQVVRYILTNNNPTLFAVQPAVDSTGTLRFRPATNRFGLASVSIIGRDNGGIDAGGVDTSARTSFMIRIDSVNNAPVYSVTVANSTITTTNGVASVTVNNWATAVAASNAPNFEGWQTIGFTFRTRNPQFYATQPSVAVTGTAGILTFIPSRQFAGRDTLDVILRDNGGLANGGVDSVKGRLIIVFNQYINVRPAFTISAVNASLTYPAIVGGTPTAISNWLTSLSAGPVAENWQTLSLTVRSFNPNIYAVAPSVNIVTAGTARAGNLSFTMSGQPGIDTVYIVLKDDGGNAFGATDSLVRKAVIRVNVNAAPNFSVSGADLSLQYPNNSTQAVNIATWGTLVNAGPAIEIPQTLAFTITSKNATLYSVAPSLAITGTTNRTAALTFTLAGVDGRDTLSVRLNDNGGTLGGGVDTLVRTLVIRVGLVSLNDKLSASEVRIYPNPTTDFVNIDLTGLNSSAPVVGYLTNLAGQQIWAGELNTQAQNQLSLGDQAAGMYLLHLVQNGKHLVQKVRKQ